MLNWTCHPNMSRVVIFPGLILAVIFRSLSFSHSPCLFCQNQPHWSSLQIYPDWGHFLPPSLVHPGPAILIFLLDCLKSLLHFLFLLLILFQSLLNIPPRCYCSNLRQMLSLHPSLGSRPRVRNSWWALTPAHGLFRPSSLWPHLHESPGPCSSAAHKSNLSLQVSRALCQTHRVYLHSGAST